MADPLDRGARAAGHTTRAPGSHIDRSLRRRPHPQARGSPVPRSPPQPLDPRPWIRQDAPGRPSDDPVVRRRNPRDGRCCTYRSRGDRRVGGRDRGQGQPTATRNRGPWGVSFDGLTEDGKRAPGLTFERRWTRPGVHPYDEITWEFRTANIASESGKTVFEQKDVEVPAFWSQLATNVVVSKYFRGHVGTPEREHSVRQLIDRVVNTIASWAETQRYFATDEDLRTFQAELTHLLVHQKMAFNSPVWFNVGIEEKPQCSACFINSVQDTMSSIMDLAKTEAMLFKYGSGAGVNLSTIRSSQGAHDGRRHRRLVPSAS